MTARRSPKLWERDEARRIAAAELVALAPEVVLCAGTLSVEGFQGVGSTLPSVFVLVIDPVGVGLVDNLAKPGGNVTGFMTYEYPQADCAECDAGGRASPCRYSLRQRSVRHHPGGRAIVRR